MNSKTAILLVLLLIGSTIYGNNKTTNSSNPQFVATNSTNSTTTQRLDSITVKYSGTDFQKYIYHYNENNLNTSIECYMRSESKANNYAYEPFYNVLGYYNETGKVNDIAIEGIGNKTPFSSKKTHYGFKYGTNGKIEQISGYSLSNLQTAPKDTTNLADIIYTYDTKGNNVSILEPIINGTISETAYNETNNKTQEIYYNFNGSKNQFIKSTKIEYAVNDKGYNSKYDLFSWSDEKWVINQSGNYNYSYDNNGSIMQAENYYFFPSTSYQKRISYFDSSQKNSLSVLPNFMLFEGTIFYQDFSLEDGKFHFNHENSLSKEYLYVWNNDKWEMGNEIFYYYSNIEKSDDVETTLNSTIKVFPNPTNKFITIDLGNNQSKDKLRLNIYSSNGQLVYESSIIEQSLTIDLSNFGKSSLYLINILNQQNKILESRKLILKY